MKYGYAKLGRSWNLDPAKWSVAGGDVDVARLLHRLATERPNDQFILVGRNSGEVPQDVGYPANVVNPWTAWRETVPKPKDFGFDLKVPKEEKAAHLAEVTVKLLAAFDDLTGATFDVLDGIMVWAGQHGTSNAPIPPVHKGWGDQLTNPQISFINYGAYIIRGINRWRSAANGEREEIWLCPDPRNYIKCRDLKWPLLQPVLAQFQQKRTSKHERYADMREPGSFTPPFEATWEGQSCWVSHHSYAYSGLEMTALARPEAIPMSPDPTNRAPFGMVVNENRRDTSNSRLDCLLFWVLPFWPQAEIRGIWTDDSKKTLGRDDITPTAVTDMYSTLQKWRCTFTTPASGSGWATAKPWECFAAGTVCFFHPSYDTQNHILPRGQLRDWLRVDTPEQLRKRVEACQDDATWTWLVTEQRKLFEERFAAHRIETMIGERLGW